MKLTCPACSALVAADGVNVERMLAKCNACNEIFSFADKFPTRPATSERIKVPLPRGVRIEDDGLQRQVVYRWFRPMYIPLLVFAVIWIGFLAVWYGLLFRGPFDRSSVIFLIFPFFHVVVGVGLLYTCFAGFLNRSWVTVTHESLTVRHGPIPWTGNCILPVEQIRQIYCDESVHRGKNSTSYTYNVHAMLTDGTTKPVLKHLWDKQLALFFEQQLEEWMKIRSEHVPGSVV